MNIDIDRILSQQNIVEAVDQFETQYMQDCQDIIIIGSTHDNQIAIVYAGLSGEREAIGLLEMAKNSLLEGE